MGRLVLGLAAVAATGLVGCSSTTLQMNAGTTEDLANSLGGYRLPEAELSVQVYLVRNNDAVGLTVAAEPPRVIPGQDLFTTSAIFDSGHEDQFTVDIDPATHFLKEISLNSQDKSLDIAKQVGASIGAIEAFNPNFFVPKAITAAAGAEAAEEIKTADVLAEALIDPSDPESIKAGNVALWRSVGNALSGWTNSQLCTAAPKAGAARDPICVMATDLMKERGLDVAAANPDKWEDQLKVLAEQHPFVQGHPAARRTAGPGCGNLSATRHGVCVRAPGQVAIGLSAPHGTTAWQSARLPIKGQEYLLNVERAMFATKTYDVVFTDGFAGKRTVSQTSEALTVVSVPKVVIDAFIDSLGGTTKALSDLIPIRVDYKNARRPAASSSSSSSKSTTTMASDGTSTGTTTTTTSQASQQAADPDAASGAAKNVKPAATAGASTKSDTGGDTKTAAAADSAKGAASNAASSKDATAGADAGPAKTDTVAAVLTPPAPALWFAVCDAGLRCAGPLASALLGTAPAGQATVLQQPGAQGDAAPDGGKLGAGGAAAVAGAGAPAGAGVTPPAQAQPKADAKPCTTPEQLATPACKPRVAK